MKALFPLAASILLSLGLVSASAAPAQDPSSNDGVSRVRAIVAQSQCKAHS